MHRVPCPACNEINNLQDRDLGVSLSCGKCGQIFIFGDDLATTHKANNRRDRIQREEERRRQIREQRERQNAIKEEQRIIRANRPLTRKPVFITLASMGISASLLIGGVIGWQEYSRKKYNSAAEPLVRELRETIAAIQVGMTYSEYLNALQKANLKWMEFDAATLQSTRPSKTNFSNCIFSLRAASDAWRETLKSTNDGYERIMQIHWEAAGTFYKRAITELAADN